MTDASDDLFTRAEAQREVQGVDRLRRYHEVEGRRLIERQERRRNRLPDPPAEEGEQEKPERGLPSLGSLVKKERDSK